MASTRETRRGPGRRNPPGRRRPRNELGELGELTKAGDDTRQGGGDSPPTPVELVAGLVPPVSTVHVDPVALEAEADGVVLEVESAARAEAAALPPAPAELEAAAQIENAVAGYNILALGIVAQGAELIFPNWHITPTEQTDLSGAMVQALMLWFPDGLIPAKYMAVLVIAGVAGKIALSRRDDSGALPPRHAPPPVKTNSAVAPPHAQA
jgi:hypothetical protein